MNMLENKPAFDLQELRQQFPILDQQVHGKDLVYLDNAATSQTPRCVIDTIADYYLKDNANIHRGVHYLSQKSTEACEQSRSKVRDFINAEKDEEIIFVRGTTEAINLVAESFLAPRLKAGDEILISHMEHHSNIVPWQMLTEKTGAILKVIPITDSGELDMAALDEMLTEKTRILGLVHIDCDFYAFSAHKMYGPTGIGVLYGREELLDSMPPYQGGGDMILSVSFEETIYNKLPHKFEAGTPHIAGIIGMGAAVDFINNTGIENIAAWEQELLDHAHEKLNMARKSFRGSRASG